MKQTAQILYSIQLFNTDAWGLVYIGLCETADYSTLADARRNSEAARAFICGMPMHVTPLGIYPDTDSGEAARASYLATLPQIPHCNATGKISEPLKTPGAKGRPVIDLNSGWTYDSATDAAYVLGVSKATMSRHLSGHLLTCAGKRLAWCDSPRGIEAVTGYRG